MYTGLLHNSWLARDVINFQNPKQKIHQSLYPHQALDGEN